MKKGYLNRLIDQYISGTIADGDRKLLEDYFDGQQLGEVPFDRDRGLRDRLLRNIYAEVELREQKVRRYTLGFGWRYVGIAAAVLLCVLGVWFFNQGAADVQQEQYAVSTRNGEKKRIKLPDGSVAVLNAGSRLSYDKAFTGAVRRVVLEGEGYFDVVHRPEQPFIVHSRQMDVRVLGTRFNVKAYAGEQPEAALIRGSIQLFLPDAKSPLVTLKPNEKFVLGKGLELSASRKLVARSADFIVSTPKIVLPAAAGSGAEWVHNRLSFDDTGFAEVAKLLERWYDVKIQINNPELLDYRFTGTFNDTGLQDILTGLSSSQEFKYRKEGQTIYIY